MLPYDQLVAMLGKLRFKDDTALRSMGLAPLAKTYDAYPVQEPSGRLYYLLKKGAEVPTARKLTPQTALSQIIVLKAEGTSVAKVWPNSAATATAAAAPAAAAVPDADKGLGTLEFVEE